MAQPWEKYRQQGAVVTPMDPYRPNEEQRAQQDQAMEAERLRIAKEQNARAASESAERRERLAQEDAAKAREREALEVAQASAMSDALDQLRNTISAAKSAKELGASGAGIGSWEGSDDFRNSTLISILGANQASNNMEALLGTVGSNTAFDRLQKMREESPTGGALGAVSEIELRLLRDSIASLSQRQGEKQFQDNMQKVIDSYQRVMGKLVDANRYYEENGSMEGYRPPSEDEIAAIVNAEISGGDNAPPGFTPPKAAGSGATEESVPVDPAYQAAYAGYIRDNWGNIDPQGLAQFRADLDRQFGYEPNTQAYASDAEALNGYAQQGVTPDQVPGVAPINQDLSWLDQVRNDAVSNPLGAFGAGYFNAGGFGIPSLMAGDQMSAMRDANPVSSTLGEISGGITGTMTGGAALGQLAGRASNPSVASLLANPLTADVGYGTIYGATQAEDPLTGAVVGAGSAALGNIVGGQIARRVPGMVGLSRPANTLNSGEQAVASQMGDTDAVAAALMEADRLGVPMTGADASPELLSLAGSATRFSPTAGGTARDVMTQRNLGQLGRMRDAIRRDLGPIDNIPQRSEEIIQQASAAAGPLYDEAYAAPGAGAIFPTIEPLLNRPSMQRALARARTIAAEEGRDPTALGFDLDDAGNTVLTRVPSWQTLDYAKRGIDDVLEGFRSPVTGRLVLDEHGRAIDATRRQFLQQVDEANPTYAQARQAYAGPAQEREYMRRGMDAISMSPDQLSTNMRRATDSQREQMQLGFQSGLSSNAGRVRDNSNPWGQIYTDDAAQRLGTLYPQDNVANLLAQRDLELRMAGNANRLVGNSMTAERGVADELFRAQPGIGGDVAQGVAETALLGGPWLSVGKTLGDRLFRERREAAANAANTRMADEIAALLFNPSPTATAGALTDVASRDAAQRAAMEEITNRALLRGGHAGAGVGASIAGLLSQ